MPLHAIEARKVQLDEFFRRASHSSISEEVRSDLAKHGIVLVCGFVEQSVKMIIMDKIAYRAHPRVQNFVRRHFERGTNYSCEAISQLLERFDIQWRDRFRVLLKSRDDLVEALRSAYTLRNSIAHGGSPDCGLSTVGQLYASAKEVIDAMEASTV